MYPKPLIIRLVEEPDVVVLLAIFNESRLSAGCFSDEIMNSEGFASQIEGEEIYIAEVDDKVVGFASVWRPEKFIHHIYVLSEYQRTGIGTALIHQIMETYGVPLSLKCDAVNTKAQSYYKRNGWIKIDESGVGENGPWNRLWLISA